MRTKITLSIVVAALSLLGTAVVTNAEAPSDRAGIDEKLGEYIPKDLVMVNERGDSVQLGSLIDRPTVVTLVYYTCPSICRPLLNEVSGVLGKLLELNMKPGEDYQVVTISFDAHDGPEGSARLKKEYMSQLPDGFPGEAWTFLTADSETIHRFTQSVGFEFKSVGEEFVHPATLVILAPDGKITRYLYGAEYLPLDLKMAIYEASEGRVGPTIARMLQFCFSYDPKGRKYVLNITRVVGTGMILSLVGFAIFLGAAGRRRAREVGE
ncbi:MAG: SCO family protein [Candidatus Latescibacterota bacterium]